MAENLNIICPIRGPIKAKSKKKDSLSSLEEFYRVEAIRCLLKHGYPKENVLIEAVIKKFGNSGKNSFRCDLAVLDCPVSDIDCTDVDMLLLHSQVLCEIKKDNSNADYVKHTQVKPMLDFAKSTKCVGLYWDDVEQRIYWQVVADGKREVFEGPISYLPKYGNQVDVHPLTLQDLEESDSLILAFNRIENTLHQASFDKSHRFEIILQLLLAKIFDEHAHVSCPDTPLEFQDFSVIGVSSKTALDRLNKLLKKTVGFYEKHLPNKIDNVFPISGDVLIEICKVLAPLYITRSKRDVVQAFYMKFAKDLYKWDLAQYFTPTTVTDFIVDVLNPQFGEHVYDPACGSADFLIAAFHKLRKFNQGYADCIWGADNSSNAVQVSVLNMLLNGDGKTNIHKVDSLETVKDRLDKYDIVVCNPPFGAKIQETRKDVLANFDLGHSLEINKTKLVVSNELLKAQESGLLFVELCIKQCKPGGRIGIILPNGYLGNRSSKYYLFRKWLVGHTKIIGVCGFPRFTFKSSGADVSASVLFLEKRVKFTEEPVAEEHSIFVELINKVGWDAGNKRATKVYKRDQEDGGLLVQEDGQLIIDSDFAEVLNDIRLSETSKENEWLIEGIEAHGGGGWTIPSSTIYKDKYLTIDPKRYCQKYNKLISNISMGSFFKLKDVVEIVPQATMPNGSKFKAIPEVVYSYVELQNIGFGDYDYTDMRGWELPDRAKHVACSGDVFVASIWSSVDKWCYISKDDDEVLVTNGCHHLRFKDQNDTRKIDLLAFMCTEAWRVQLRALARGSDGLAEISEEDLLEIVIPIIFDDEARSNLSTHMDEMYNGLLSFEKAIKSLTADSKSAVMWPAKRSSHISLV